MLNNNSQKGQEQTILLVIIAELAEKGKLRLMG